MKQGWESKKLGDVCEIYQPTTISKKMMILDGEYPVFGANGIIGRYDKYNHDNPELLVTCRGATCGSVNISLPNSWINGNAMVIRPKTDGLRRDFLTYFFKGAVDLSGVITGSAQPQITRTSLNPVLVPIPPLEEQKQIVAKLDQCFEAIDKAKANAAKNLENAKELFQSKLNDIFSQKGEGWVEKKLGDVTTLMTGGTPRRSNKEYFENGDIKWLVSGDIHLKEINDCKERITQLGLDNSNAKYLPENSVMIALNGQGKTRGTVALLRTKATCNQSLVAIYPNDEDELMPEYVFTNLDARYQEIREITGDGGNDRRGLNMPLIRGIVISFPASASEQELIIKQVQTLREKVQSLKSKYQQELNFLEELKKSILQKAFEGEL
jgi:type I restriction enzyme S subunit